MGGYGGKGYVYAFVYGQFMVQCWGCAQIGGGVWVLVLGNVAVGGECRLQHSL